jgi:hypothetical protein
MALSRRAAWAARLTAGLAVFVGLLGTPPEAFGQG